MLVEGGEGKPACDDKDDGDEDSPKMKHEVVSFRDPLSTLSPNRISRGSWISYIGGGRKRSDSSSIGIFVFGTH